MYQALVGVNHLLEVDRLVDIMGEGSIMIEVLVGCNNVVDRKFGLYNLSGKDATGKVATIRNKVDRGREVAIAGKLLHLIQALAYLRHMLMLERLVYAHVVVAPREVGSGTWFLTSTC